MLYCPFRREAGGKKATLARLILFLISDHLRFGFIAKVWMLAKQIIEPTLFPR
jgi:hypothetical protein